MSKVKDLMNSQKKYLGENAFTSGKNTPSSKLYFLFAALSQLQFGMLNLFLVITFKPFFYTFSQQYMSFFSCPS